jgi:hypothetical protein
MRNGAPDDPIEQSQTASPPRPARLDRQFGKQLFREMIKLQIEDGPLRWSQRRELVKFARRLGIDTFEARLIIRAVEYECGVAAPAGLDDRQSIADTRFVSTSDASLTSLARPLLIPITVMIAILLAWMLYPGH